MHVIVDQLVMGRMERETYTHTPKGREGRGRDKERESLHFSDLMHKMTRPRNINCPLDIPLLYS
jgi:hypothetical protein